MKQRLDFLKGFMSENNIQQNELAQDLNLTRQAIFLLFKTDNISLDKLEFIAEKHNSKLEILFVKKDALSYQELEARLAAQKATIETLTQVISDLNQEIIALKENKTPKKN